VRWIFKKFPESGNDEKTEKNSRKKPAIAERKNIIRFDV